MNLKRVARISQEIRKALSYAISFELNDPKIGPVTSITDTKVSNDLSYADIYVAVMGTDWDKNQTMEALENATGYLKNYIANHVKLRIIPELRFHLDRSIDRGLYMDQLIKETIAEDRANQIERGEIDGNEDFGGMDA